MSNAAARLPENRHFTYADYKDWELAEGERYELIDGEAYAMAGPSAYHQTILVELVAQFAAYLRNKPCKAYMAPFDVRLFYEEDESDDTVVQPDLIVVCDEKKRGPESCRGAPDLVVEVLSPSNTAIEMQRKFELYRQAGVLEYWVLDPKYKTLLVHYFENGQVRTCTFGAADTVPVKALPGLEVALGPAFAG
ncbi:MAG: Uma2 family endonuclease [Treponema sp.]|jgi:Uma2 family endonuclease|nr:Uma2 family endonuclease [Treponema sp.]